MSQEDPSGEPRAPLRRLWAFVRRRRDGSGRAAVETPQPAEPTAALAAVFDLLPDPVMLVAARDSRDLAGRRVLLANAASRALFRLPAEPVPLVGVLRDPEVMKAVEAALEGEERRVDYVRSGARDRHWSALARPIPEPGTGGRLAMLLLRDETEARSLDAMRADFLANASHELRSPLASLTGFIDTLRGPARDDAEARDRFLGIMAAQADRMGRLIADLLALSRIELDEHVPPRGAVDLDAALGDVVDAMTPTLADRRVRVERTGAAAGEALVTGDRDQIVQVLQNLVENAVKYSPDGGAVTVEVVADFRPGAMPREAGLQRMPLSAPERAPGAAYAAVRVRDRGPGIERRNLPRLSERFYRVEGQKSGDRLGTGLGLAIVKHIVNRHRGGLVVESAPGEGSLFTVYLPRAAAAPDGAAAAQRNKTVVQTS